MKTYRFLTLVLAFTLLIAACSPAKTPTAEPRPTAAPTTAPTAEPAASGPSTGLQTQPEANAWANAPEAVLAARATLVAQINVDPDTIALISTEQIDWPDACLGISSAGKVCAQVITSGYKVILSTQDKQYEFHTNAVGSVVLQADQGLSSGGPKPGGMLQTNQQAQLWANAPQAALAARADLRQKLSVDPDTIGLVSVEKVEWPSACLGTQNRGIACVAAVTPGYKIVLGGGEKQYEYHTDETGSDLVLANP